jgi:hypothetical protein
MATTKTAPGVTSRGRETPPPGDSLAVSPARWVGVALVVGALVTAMVMAMTSRVERGTGETPRDAVVGVLPSPTPIPVASGEGVPTELPEVELTSQHVSDPLGGYVTSERAATLSVVVPETVIRTRDLTLLILHDGELVETVQRPSGTEDPKPITLDEGPNRLSARLAGPNGAGPVTTDIVLRLDTKPPSLSISDPRDHQPMEGERVTVRGESEPGANVVILNRKTDESTSLTIGPSGEFEEVMTLDPGENDLRIRAVDTAGNVKILERAVDRAGAGVRPRIDVNPGQLSARKLPLEVRVIARLDDRDRKPVKGARVTFTLSVPGLATARSQEIVSGNDGVAVWKVEIPSEGVELGDAQVTLVAELPTGQKVDAQSGKVLTIVR